MLPMLQKTLKYYLEKIQWPQLDKRGRNKAAKDSSLLEAASPAASTANVVAAASAPTSPPAPGLPRTQGGPTSRSVPRASPLPVPDNAELAPQLPQLCPPIVRRFPVACGGNMGQLLLPLGPQLPLMVRHLLFNRCQ